MYLSRIEEAVRENISHGTNVIALMFWNLNEREGYWEREYMIAWQNDKQSGTHRAHIDSEGRSALFVGNYFRATGDAIADFCDRAGLES